LDAIYWDRIRESVKSIKIVSDDDIPWEFILPKNLRAQDISDSEFWCERFDIGHWFVGKAPNEKIQVDKLDMVKAISDSSSDSEEKTIKALLPGYNIAFRPVDPIFDIVSAAFASSDRNRSIFHLICHGVNNPNDPNQSYIKLGNLHFSPDDLDECTTENSIIFLNGCETGISGPGLSGEGGWPYKLIRDTKADLFVGTVVKVPGELASRFAIAFYRSLFPENDFSRSCAEGSSPSNRKKSILKAARDARNSIKPDPTFLSYKVYGSPIAQIRC
ncbi:MAG: hypothetical protein AAFN65_10795, partial [Bacteroidota bacterium]